MTDQTSFAGVPTAWTYNNLSEILTSTVGTGSLAQTTTNTWDALGDELYFTRASTRKGERLGTAK